MLDNYSNSINDENDEPILLVITERKCDISADKYRLTPHYLHPCLQDGKIYKLKSAETQQNGSYVLSSVCFDFTNKNLIELYCEFPNK